MERGGSHHHSSPETLGVLARPSAVRATVQGLAVVRFTLDCLVLQIPQCVSTHIPTIQFRMVCSVARGRGVEAWGGVGWVKVIADEPAV